MSVSKGNNDNKEDNEHHNKNDKNKWYFIVFQNTLRSILPFDPYDIIGMNIPVLKLRRQFQNI